MVVTPYYAPHEGLLDYLRCFAMPDDVVLDVGSGDRRFHDIGAKEVWSLDSWYRAEPDYLLDLNESDLPTDREFSLILMIDLIEHLPKDRGKQIIEQAKRITKRAVMVLTPLRWHDNHEPYYDPNGFYYGNENVWHRSLWRPADFSEFVRVELPSLRNYYFGYWVNY